MLTKRIDELLSENKLCRADIVRGTGIGESTIRGWYKGRIPSAEALLKVAQYLEVTVEWLLTGEDDSRSHRPILSVQERKLIEVFRQLDERDKNTVLKIVHSMRSDSSYGDCKSYESKVAEECSQYCSQNTPNKKEK